MSNQTWKLPWVKPIFYKVCREAASNFKKLLEVGKHFKEFLKFPSNFPKFVEFVNNFRKLAEFASNFTKFVGLTNNFYKVRRSCKQLCKVSFCKVRKNCTKFVKFGNNFTKFGGLPNNLWTVCKTCKNFLDSEGFWIGRSDLSAWKFFLCLSFTSSNIFLSKHICSVNTFHVSWILFMKKLNSSHYIHVDKIYGTVKKWLLVTLDRWMDLCMDLWVVVMDRWLFYKGAL